MTSRQVRPERVEWLIDLVVKRIEESLDRLRDLRTNYADVIERAADIDRALRGDLSPFLAERGGYRVLHRARMLLTKLSMLEPEHGLDKLTLDRELQLPYGWTLKNHRIQVHVPPRTSGTGDFEYIIEVMERIEDALRRHLNLLRREADDLVNQDPETIGEILSTASVILALEALGLDEVYAEVSKAFQLAMRQDLAVDDRTPRSLRRGRRP